MKLKQDKDYKKTTVHNLAAEYSYYERGDDVPGEGGYDLTKLEAFSKGAETVLNILEEHIRKYHFITPFDATAIDLLDKIRELRG